MGNYKVYITKTTKEIIELELNSNDKNDAEKMAYTKAIEKNLKGVLESVDYKVENVVESDSEDKFWEIIEKVNWKKDNSYKRVASELSILPKDLKKELRDFCDSKTNELQKKFEEEWLKPGSDGIECSDDGWGDLCADVVGRGKTFYYSVTKKKLQKMAINLDYVENFLYSFHD